MIVVDLEMTGLDVERHCIISLGAIDFFQPTRMLYLECRIRPGAEYDEQAFLVHGLSNDYLSKQSLSEQQLLMQFSAWAGQSPTRVLMGQNVWTDAEFLRRAYELYHFDWLFGHRIIDLHSVAVAHHYLRGKMVPLKNATTDLGLDKISQYCGIPKRNSDEPHNALTDAKFTAECLSRLLLGKPLLPEFVKYPVSSP
jgi:DNA polymerase III epsilon subunit-like protein